MGILRKTVCFLLAFTVLMQSHNQFTALAQAKPAAFHDVPNGHWAYDAVHRLRDKGITTGLGQNKFGLGQAITRAEFTTFVVKLFDWQSSNGQNGKKAATFTDNADPSAWYYTYVEAAAAHGATDVPPGEAFRPNVPITREEMAVMLVKALGYDTLAQQLNALPSPFQDVTRNKGYMTIAKDFGIISGMSATTFAPAATATREQAAAMLMRLEDNLNRSITFVNGFYAIKSASQMDKIPQLNSVGFGWARLESAGGTVILNETATNSNEYNRPSGYEQPLAMAKNSGSGLLMVTAQEVVVAEGQTLTAKLVTDEKLTNTAIAEILKAMPLYDGVVVDLEGLKGQAQKEGLNRFLTKLKEGLGTKQMFVAVHPVVYNQSHYDGYDYRTIGQLADKVILMAHDYNAKALTTEEMAQGIVMTPLAPLSQVYTALQAITDPNTGVPDKSKILLQISFDTAQWKVQEGQVVNQTPYRPDYATLQERMNKGVNVFFDEKSMSPYITFIGEDGLRNVVWYENGQSTSSKIDLAKMFGITGISIWRLGNVPEDAWGALLGG